MHEKHENSILFSLKELRKIERDRVQQHADEDRKRIEEGKRKAEEDQLRRREEEERYNREEEERVRREENLRIAQLLQSDLENQVAVERERMQRQFQQQMLVEQQRLREQLISERNTVQSAQPRQTQGRGLMTGLIIGMVGLAAFAGYSVISGNSKAETEMNKRRAAVKRTNIIQKEISDQMAQLSEEQKKTSSKLDNAQKENKELKEKLEKAERETAELRTRIPVTTHDPHQKPVVKVEHHRKIKPPVGEPDKRLPIKKVCDKNDPTCFE